MPTQTRTLRRSARTVLATLLCVAVVAGCSDDGDPAPTPTGQGGPNLSVDIIKGALLKPSDLGQTWLVPVDQSPPPNTVIALCAGNVARPAVPGSPTSASLSAADEGEAGAQTFDQYGLVYPDAAAANAARDTLSNAVERCPPSVKASSAATTANPEAGYTETVQITPLVSGVWSGFAVMRHKEYEASSPGTADTAIAVLASRNVVLIASYAVYRVDKATAAADFVTAWKRLVGTLVKRIDTKASPAK